MQHTNAKFLAPTQAYVLLNSTDEEIVMMYGGETIRIPPRNKILRKHPKYDDVVHSLVVNGKYVPGTVVVRDKTTSGLYGELTSVWSAQEAMRSRLGVDIRTGECTSEYFKRGVTVLTTESTIADIKAADVAGVARYMRWKQRDSARILFEHDTRNARRKASGMSELPPSEEYLRAEAALKTLGQQEAARLQNEFSTIWHPVMDNTIDLYDDPDTPVEDAESDILDLGTPNDAAVDEALETLKLKEQPVQPIGKDLAELVMNDPKALKELRKNYNMRKRAAKKAGAAA